MRKDTEIYTVENPEPGTAGGEDSSRICEAERELLGDLEHGLASGEFQLYLQFIVDARSYKIVGGEALSRWLHPRKGLLSPDRYVPLFEKEDRIERLDFYNLDQACGLLEKLGRTGGIDVFITCNLSRRSFARADLAERCRAIIGRHGFPRRNLVIEITESGYTGGEEIPQMRGNIQAVRSLGVRVMLDDFGMGYTAFRDLLRFPMDGLKLDKSLVDSMGTETGRIVLEGIVRTGHRLGLTILAEGVETQQQVEELSGLNCDLLQGYLFSQPLPAAEALRQLANQNP